MSGTDIFIDTNICIYLLDGDLRLANLLQDQNIHISFITEMELFSYHVNDAASVKILDTFIASVTVIDITQYIKQQAIELRKTYKLKLPDSIIAGSALAKNLPFVTADKGFKKVTNLDLVFYDLS